MRAIGLLLALAAGGAAADLGSEPKSIKALYSELAQHDLWSAMQLEAWAKPQNLRLPGAPAFGAGTIIFGDPLFATPEDIYTIADYGDQVQVLTKDRWHCFAVDGRPLAPSVALGMVPTKNGRSFTHGFVGMADWIYNRGDPIVQLRELTLPKGEVVVDEKIGEAAGAGWGSGNLAVAEDGSALVVPFADSVSGQCWLDLSTKKDQRIKIDGLSDPRGVGAQGTWIIATDDHDRQVLLVGKDRTSLEASAIGPGIAAVVAGGHVRLIGKDGKPEELNLPFGVGKNPVVMTVGHFLAVASGDGATMLEDSDFMGAVNPDPPPQPPSVAIYKWEDLLANHQADAFEIDQGQIDLDRTQPASLLLFKGPKLTRLDLAGKQLQRVALYSAPRDIGWAYSGLLWTVVTMHGQSVVIDDQGRELWSGEGEVQVKSREYAVVITGEPPAVEYTLVHLALDPSARSAALLKLNRRGEWAVHVDPYQQNIMALQEPRWMQLDLTGAMTMSGDKRCPPFGEVPWTIGRFYFRFGRIYPKASEIHQEPKLAEPKLSETPRLNESHPLPPKVGTGKGSGKEPRPLCPQDAWFAEDCLLILDRDGWVDMVTFVKNLEHWEDLGRAPQAQHWGLRNRTEPVLINGSWRIVGSLSDDPPRVHPEDGSRVGDEMPPGSWRIKKLDFVPPSSGQMSWSDQRAGFTPRLLRSSSSQQSDLLVITASLVMSIPMEATPLISGSGR